MCVDRNHVENTLKFINIIFFNIQQDKVYINYIIIILLVIEKNQ